MRAWLRQPLSFGLWLATCFAIGLLFAGGYWLNRQVSANRVRAIEELCQHDNANAQHNIEFLRALRVSPETLGLARRTFKLTPDCKRFAENTVNEKP
jgi:hypothetical protein